MVENPCLDVAEDGINGIKGTVLFPAPFSDKRSFYYSLK
jgi:hypothetical protein